MDGTTTEMAAAGTVRRGGLRICVLGAARAELLVGSGAPPERVELGGARPRRLLLALAVDAGQAVSADRLAERVWGARLPADPRAALHTLVSRLRQALGAEVIATDGPGYRLAVGAQDEAGRATLDALTFQSLVRTAAAPELGPLPRIELLGAALDLWHGAAFDEVAGEDWARAEAERLEELRLGALERRFDALLAAGRHTDALPALAGAVEANPLRDRLVGQQMLALFRAGRQAEAARVFQAHRARLATDLGLEPGHELVELDRRIVAGDPSLALEAIARRPPPAAPESRALRGYQLGERLGEGAFAVVFRGTQPTLGRDVAVKVIRAELANRPEFIRRFEAEAHLVAAIEHPHVVPLYDYWREPDRAYLVFRYLRGGTLEARLTAGSPLPRDQVRTLAVQVGAALTAAHRAGVVHRDVKPANVFLDELGNFYLGDFGIALVGTELTDPTAALSAGSPAYAAPEQLRRERIGPPADVHGLGITLYEALTGQLPFPDAVTHAELLQRQLNQPIPAVRPRRHDVPPALDEVLARATAKAPGERFGGVGDFVEAFVAALDGGPAAAVLRRRGSATQLAAVAERNPYKGLRAFDEADAADFKGRARLVDRLVSGLSRGDTAGRLAVVVGPSGMGKSSVVRAGLLPALRHGAAPGSERWFVATMLPGREPFEELAAALLRVASAAPANLMGQLTEDHRGLARVLKALAPEGGDGAVLLVIDQFEELFTLCADDVARRRFLDSLEYALTDARCPIRLVVTMRADFYDRPLRHGSFARLIEPSTVAVTALAPDELEAAIVEPAASVGCEFEPGLVSEIVADIGDQPGALPLLQYALTELWERRVSGLLTRDAYRALGGVTGALGATAERLYAESSEAERLALRRLFGRLVTLGEGVEDTRRRVTVRELEADPALDAVVTRFGAARLLSFDRDPATREPTIEVAHEALLREWPRLREWLAEDRDGLRVVRHLTAASAAWEASGRDAGELYRGGRLESAQVWAAEHPSGLNQAETAFLSASTERQRAERAATRRQVRRLRGALAGVGVVAVLALLAGLLAVRQQRRADGEAALALRQSERADASVEQAETRRLVADAAALVGQNRDVALLLASEAYRRDPGPQTLAGLQRVLTSTGPYLGTIGAGLDFVGVDVLADGTIVGLTKTDLQFYDPETFALTAALALPAPPTEIYDVVPFDVRGAMVAVGNDQGSVLLVEGGVPRVLPLGTVPVRAVAVGDGVVAAATTDGQLHLVDAVTGVERWRTVVLAERSYEELLGPDRWAAVPPSLTSLLVGAEGVVFRSGAPSVLFDADGSVVVGGPRILRLDGASGRVLQQLAPLDATGLPRLGANLMARPGGGYVSASSNSVYTVDATLTAATFGAVPTGRADLNVNVRSLAIDPTGQPVYGLTNGQVARGIAESPLEGADNAATGLGSARGLRYRADGTLLVAGEGGIVVWGDDGRQLLAKAVPRTGHPGATVTPDGREVVTGTPSGTNPSARYDVGSQPPRRLPTPPLPPHWALAASPDPLSRFVEAFADGEAVRVFDRATLALVATIPDVSFGATSLDGRWMAQAQSFGNGNGVRVFDTTTWQQVSPMIDLTGWLPQTQSLGGVVPGFDATRSRLFTSIQETGTTIVFDTATWQPTTVIERADNGGVVAARFSRDGRVLVTLAIDGAIHERDPDTWVVKRTIAGGTSSSDNLDLGLYLSPDGAYLVTTRDARPRLWRLPTATLVGSFPHKNGLTASGADLGDQLQLVTLDDANVLLWNLDVTTWPAIACRAAGRNLTQAEWKQFGPKDVPRQQTCPQWPPGA